MPLIIQYHSVKMHKEDLSMSRSIKINGNQLVTIVTADSSESAITPTDVEMDVRAKEAVKSAINRAKTCKKPIARYDRVNRKAYIETANGEKIYVR